MHHVLSFLFIFARVAPSASLEVLSLPLWSTPIHPSIQEARVRSLSYVLTQMNSGLLRRGKEKRGVLRNANGYVLLTFVS